tara:strand:- start:14 stop:673 length:660 start_codon:yes stop_codon:yes gene_type:complete
MIQIFLFQFWIRIASIFYQQNILQNIKFEILKPQELIILEKYFNISFLISYSQLSEEVINFYLEKNTDLDLSLILLLVSSQRLTESQLIKYQHIFPKELFCFYQQLNEDFIKNNLDLVNWDIISLKQKFNKNFIIDYQEKLNWYIIIKNKSLSLSFIYDFPNQIKWDAFCRFGNLDKQILDDFKDQINWRIIREERQLTDKEQQLLKNYNQYLLINKRL